MVLWTSSTTQQHIRHSLPVVTGQHSQLLDIAVYTLHTVTVAQARFRPDLGYRAAVVLFRNSCGLVQELKSERKKEKKTRTKKKHKQGGGGGGGAYF